MAGRFESRTRSGSNLRHLQVLRNKWYFDELYHAIFVRPVHVHLASSPTLIAGDRRLIDALAPAAARSRLDDMIDRYLVDGAVNVRRVGPIDRRFAARVQTGKLRQYVMLIVIGTVALTLFIKLERVAATNESQT